MCRGAAAARPGRGRGAQRHDRAHRGHAGRGHRRGDERRLPAGVRRVPGTVAMVTGLLSGLRVLDLTRFVAGSQATMLLAAMGAEVIKIEVPPGDPYRAQGTERVNGESALFLALNAGKRSVAIDFRAPAGRQALEPVLASADMLMENSRPGSLTAYGLDWESVHAGYPALVYGSISGYGDVGPDATRGGFDLILQAESGVMSVTGTPESGPVKVGAPVLDVGAGISCALGLLAGYIGRLRTGTGSLVSASL